MAAESNPDQASIAAIENEILSAGAHPVLELLRAEAHRLRRETAEDPRLLASPLSGATTEINEIYDLIVEGERSLAAPNLLADEYATGTASYEDELRVVGSGAMLMEAQHATAPVRKHRGAREGADHGTAGLAYALAQRHHGTAIVPIGLQTGNANANDTHPIKQIIADYFEASHPRAFLSLHGCRPGKITSLHDETEIHAVVGLGQEPRAASIEAAETLVEHAAAYGLRVVIGNTTPHFNFYIDAANDTKALWDITDWVETDDEGHPKPSRLAAKEPNTTTSFVNRITPGRPQVPVMQLEISRSLRLTPEDLYARPGGLGVRKYAVYLGYCLARLAAEISVPPDDRVYYS